MGPVWCSPVRRTKLENHHRPAESDLKCALNIRGSCLPYKEFFIFPGLSGGASEPYDPQAILNRCLNLKEAQPGAQPASHGGEAQVRL